VDLPQALQVTLYWVLARPARWPWWNFRRQDSRCRFGWDLLHTLLRIPVGAFLAAATLSPDGGELGLAGLAAGAGVATLTHVLKSGTRALIKQLTGTSLELDRLAGRGCRRAGRSRLGVRAPVLSLALVFGLGLLVFGPCSGSRAGCSVRCAQT
jgi:hypothetical protein